MDNVIGDFVFFFDWIEITNRTDSTKVDFYDGVEPASLFKLPDLFPGSISSVLKNLQTKTRYQLKNSTQYLISDRLTSIVSSSHNHLLVEVSCLKAPQPPGKIYSALNNTFERCICIQALRPCDLRNDAVSVRTLTMR